MPPLRPKLPAVRRTLQIARPCRRVKRPKLFSRSIQMIPCNTSISLITVTVDGWLADTTGAAVGTPGERIAGSDVGPTTIDAGAFKWARWRTLRQPVRRNMLLGMWAAPKIGTHRPGRRGLRRGPRGRHSRSRTQ